LGYNDDWEMTNIFKIVNDFFQFRVDNKQIYQHSGQIMSLEHLLMLNDDFYENPVIKIKDAVRTPMVKIYNKGEPYPPVYLWNVGEIGIEPLMLYNNEEYEAEVDFIVRIYLETISDDYKAYLGSLIDKFKIAGKKYKILAEHE